MLGRKWWNKGYATEALCTVRDYWFDTVGADWLAAVHANENIASSAVLQKAGFVYDRDVTDRKLDGTPVPCRAYHLFERGIMTDNTRTTLANHCPESHRRREAARGALLALDQGRYDMARSLDELRALADPTAWTPWPRSCRSVRRPRPQRCWVRARSPRRGLSASSRERGSRHLDGELTGSQIRNLSAAL